VCHGISKIITLPKGCHTSHIVNACDGCYCVDFSSEVSEKGSSCKSSINRDGPSGPFSIVLKFLFWRAPCKGGASRRVRIPPGDVAPAGSNRSSHGVTKWLIALGKRGRGG